MKKRKKKNAITLLALVITIVIMLLLAGVAIQMTMGENGLIAKSVQAQKEQAKAELYDTAKLNYTSLNAKAFENGQPSPEAELALSTTEFRDRYDIVGDNITDKKGTVIDTKENVLNVISGLKGASEDTEISMKGEYVEKPWPKKVAGVTIPEEDKDKMILKVKVLRKEETEFILGTTEEGEPSQIVNIDYGNGIIRDVTDYEYGREYMEYEPGEYIVKIKNHKKLIIRQSEYSEIEVLQWGKKITGNSLYRSEIEIPNVSKVYEPEQDGIKVLYMYSKFTEIPEWIFSKKVTNTNMSYFYGNDRLTSIPEGLFKNNVNVTEFSETFVDCTGLTSIPEGLFKNNVNVTKFGETFRGCTGLTSISEGLFKNNANVTEFRETFRGCTGLTSIPEGLFKNNVNVTEFRETFVDCTGLTSIPEGLFKNNANVTEFRVTFGGCTGLTSIPEGVFKNNVNVKGFESTFGGCTGLTSIPENLFKYNVNVTDSIRTFERCTGIISIPEKIIEFGKQVKEKGGQSYGMFLGCTSASNYNSLPNYIKY